MSGETYDAWKTRADLDEQLPEHEEQRDECGTCGGLDGSHDSQCPDGSFGDFIDREIDRIKEEQP